MYPGLACHSLYGPGLPGTHRNLFALGGLKAKAIPAEQEIVFVCLFALLFFFNLQFMKKKLWPKELAN